MPAFSHEARTRARQWSGLTLVIFALAIATGCSTSSSARARESDLRAREHVEQAMQLTDQGQLDQALVELSLAIDENPTLTTAHLSMGEIYSIKGDYVAAEESYSRAVQIEPRNFEAQYGHGLALQLLSRLTEAVRAYLRALSIDPDNFNANLNLATAYLQSAQAKQALPYASHAVEVDPEDGPARVNLGAIYATLGDQEAAIREYQAAAELMDLSAPLLLNLADSLGKTGRYQEMVNTLEQLLKIAPSARAYERLGFAHFRLLQYDNALKAFSQSITLDSAHYPALNGMGVCLLNKFLISDRTDATARRQGVAALRRSLRIRRDQPRIVDLISRYG